jgi:hypothetical protein
MALAIPFIDAILENDLKATFNQRHTAHQIWGRTASRDASMRCRGIDCPGVRAGPEG